ncbi:MAG: hypothetical protein RLZZ230_943 [Candidatus Parcubacteria bacterium]|jgi:hypothetical protein
MFDFHQKRKLRTVVNSPYTQGVLLMLALAVGWSAYVRYSIAMEMLGRREQAEQQATALEARKQALEEKVQYLSSERGQEAEMRRQFDVALPGEQVVVIVDKDDSAPEVLPLATSTDSQSKRSWYQFWQ